VQKIYICGDVIIEIRLAIMNDIEALCPILTEFFAYNAELQPTYCTAAIEGGEYPKSIIESDNSDFLIAIENDVIVGFIQFFGWLICLRFQMFRIFHPL